MTIQDTVNYFWPATIRKLALKQEHLPDGVPYFDVFVELFEGATLPNPDDVRAKQADYDAIRQQQIADADAAAKVPDLATQLFAALTAKGTLTADDLHPSTLAEVNSRLEIAGAAAIASVEAVKAR